MALNCGVQEKTPCLTVNRLCGSGFQSIVNGAQEIQLKEAEVALCAGAENMSMSPYAVRGVRFGTKLGVDLKVCQYIYLNSQGRLTCKEFDLSNNSCLE